HPHDASASVHRHAGDEKLSTLGVLALHGFGGSPSELGFLLDRLGDAGYACSAPLLPGHRTSPRDLQSRTFAEWLEAARESLRQLYASHERVAVVGFSMGSLLALSLGAEAGERGGVAGVVVLGCALRLRAPLRAVFGLATATRVRLPDAYVL